MKKQQELLNYWAELFGAQKAKKILEIIGPFCDWQPKLGSLVDSLKEKIAKIVFWQKVSGIVPVAAELFSFWPGLKLTFGQSLVEKFGEELKGNLTREDLDSLQLGLQDSLPFGVKQSKPIIDDKLWAALEDLWYGLGSSDLKYLLRVEMRLNLWTTLFYGTGFRLAGDKSKKFQPLFALWLAGNFPAWFDRQGRLIILCAADP